MTSLEHVVSQVEEGLRDDFFHATSKASAALDEAERALGDLRFWYAEAIMLGAANNAFDEKRLAAILPDIEAHWRLDERAVLFLRSRLVRMENIVMDAYEEDER